MRLKTLILIAFGLSGMAALIYEVVWTRPLSLIFGSSVYAVSIMLTAFMAGLALGSWLFSSYADKVENPLKLFAFIELGIGLYGLLLIPIFNILPGFYVDLYSKLYSHFSIFFIAQFMLVFAVLLIPTTLMGATWPVINKAYVKQIEKLGKGTGTLYSINNFGAVIGAFIAGFILIPFIGIKLSIIFAALINIFVAIIILLSIKLKKHAVVIALIFVLLFFLTPKYNSELLNYGVFIYADPSTTIDEVKEEIAETTTLFYKEGLYSAVAVQESKEAKILKINGKIQCSSDIIGVDELKRIAQLPYSLFIKNYAEPKTALNIGLGCGITSSFLVGKALDTTTVEIDPLVVGSNEFFKDINNDVLRKENHNLAVDDARNWLMLNDKKFDIITTQPIDPWNERANNLFSLEFFELQKQHLTENGIVAQWVPGFEMTFDDFKTFYKTFNKVFPYIYVYRIKPGSEQLLFVGSNKPLEIDETYFYVISNNEIPEFDVSLNTDNNPVFEFSVAKNIYNREPKPITKMLEAWRSSNIKGFDNEVLI